MKQYDATLVAEYMLRLLEKYSYLDYDVAIHNIKSKFGDDYLYKNGNLTVCINKDVLDEFKLLYKKLNRFKWNGKSRSWEQN